MRQELGDAYVNNLFELYENRVPQPADFVTYWFERSRELIAKGTLKRAGLLSTQSIRAGASRKVLEHIKESGDIFLGYADRPWILNGAAVRVSIVGFDNGDEKVRQLEDQTVTSINANLTTSLDLTKAQRLSENRDIAFVGSLKTGPFDIDERTAQTLLQTKGNPNGRPNSDVVKPSANGIDIVNRPRHMWIIDFGTEVSVEEAALYEKPFEYIREHVYPERAANRRAARAQRWWIHGDPAPKMRVAINQLSRYIATARVAKHRIFVWLTSPTLPDYKLCVIARNSDYFFGILHSCIHELWSLATSSRHGIGNDPAYSVTTCFETFPFPWAPGQEPSGNPKVEAIAEAARELVEKRDNWLNPAGATADELKKRTLTNLYNQRPTWLDNAHKRLDKAVFAAYDWPDNLSDEEILEKLLVLNLERASN
jgi:type II restriction/modification system DNA methylase subunit YeeA